MAGADLVGHVGHLPRIGGQWLVLFVSPPGRVANWTNWAVLGLTKHEWVQVHVCFSTLFLTVAVFHLVLNWRPLMNYLKNRVTLRIGFRWEWVVHCFCAARSTAAPGRRAAVLVPARPQRVSEAALGRPAPTRAIPHAELLTVEELAQKASVDLPTATARLAAKGLRDFSPTTIVDTLASKSGLSAQQIFLTMQAEPTSRAAGAAVRVADAKAAPRDTAARAAAWVGRRSRTTASARISTCS